MAHNSAVTENVTSLSNRQPDELAGIFHDALQHTSGPARCAFIERSELGPEACAIAVAAVAVIEGMEVHIDDAWRITDEAVKTLRWAGADAPEVRDVLLDLSAVLNLLHRGR